MKVFFSQNFDLQKFNDYFMSLKGTLPNTTILVYLSKTAKPLLKNGVLLYDDYKWIRKQFPVHHSTIQPLTLLDYQKVFDFVTENHKPCFASQLKYRNMVIFAYLINGYTGNKIISMTVYNYSHLDLTQYNLDFKEVMDTYLSIRTNYALQSNKILFIGYNNKPLSKECMYKIIKQYQTINENIKTNLFIL